MQIIASSFLRKKSFWNMDNYDLKQSYLNIYNLRVVYSYVGLETSSPLNVKSKGRARARAVLGDSKTQDPWWCGGSRSPDMGRPTYGSARMVYVGEPNCRNPPGTGNTVAYRSGT